VQQVIQAARAGDWTAAGTANLHFHSRIAALHRSTRVDELFRRLMTELRLGFLALPDPRAFHEPYLRRNRHLAGLIQRGDVDRAVAALREAGVETARLWVLEENARARRFYEKRGWRPDGSTRVVEYPPNPLDVGYSLDLGSGDRSALDAPLSM